MTIHRKHANYPSIRFISVMASIHSPHTGSNESLRRTTCTSRVSPAHHLLLYRSKQLLFQFLHRLFMDSPPVPSSSRGSSCPSSLTSAPEPPQSLPLHAHIAGHYRLVTPYRLLLLPGNLLLIEDFPSPLHHLFSFRFAISEYEDRRLLRSHVSLLLAVHPFSVCRSLDRAHLLPLQRLDQFIQRPKIVRSFFSISLLRTMSSSSAIFFSSIALSCCLPRLKISSLPRVIFASNSEPFFSHCSCASTS